MEFTAPLFDDMKTYMTKYFDQDEIDEKIDPLALGSGFMK
jgi:23S rRNA pseudouridine1911/1915/1917 synthase